jgi:hypothetical protein
MPKNDPYDPNIHGPAELLEYCHQRAAQTPSPQGSQCLRALTLFYQHISPILECDHPITEFLHQICHQSARLHRRLYPGVRGE